MARLFPYQVYVETDRPEFPQVCICCGEEADTDYRPLPPQRRPGLPADKPLLLPYCSECLKHLRSSQNFATAQLVALNIAIWGVAIPMVIGLAGAVFAAGPAAGAAIYLHARSQAAREINTKPACAAKGVVCRVVWHRRMIYIFSFLSESYAERFREANRDLLVEEPDAVQRSK